MAQEKMASKPDLIQKIADQHSGSLTRKDVKGIIESLASVGYKELKKTGAFVLPGFAKFVVVKKAATKARKGINPFTKEPTIFKAKPARKLIKARPVKAVKDAVGANSTHKVPIEQASASVKRSRLRAGLLPGAAG